MKLAFYRAFQPKGKDETYISYVKRLWLDWVIAAASFGRYSHVELVDGEDWFSISPRTGVAQKRRIVPKTGRWVFVDLKLDKMDRKNVRKLVLEYEGYKYDYLGAITSILPFCVQKNNKLFCSEAAVNVLRKTVRYRWLRDGCRYSPSKLYRSIT